MVTCLSAIMRLIGFGCGIVKLRNRTAGYLLVERAAMFAASYVYVMVSAVYVCFK